MGSNENYPEVQKEQNVQRKGTDVLNTGRGCTDVSFLVIFIIFVTGLIAVTWHAVLLGDPNRIIYGTDSWGNVCNQKNNVIGAVAKSRTGLNLEGRSFLFYFNYDVFRPVDSNSRQHETSVRICVTSCPTGEITTLPQLVSLAASSSRLCVYDIPLSAYFVGSSSCTDDCPPLPVHAHSTFLNRCVPNDVKMTLVHVFDVIDSVLNTLHDDLLQKGISDIKSSWFQICILCVMSLVVAFVITILLQFLARIIIWLMIVTMVTGSLVATVTCWTKYHTVLEDSADAGVNRARAWLIGSICATVISVILILVLIVLRKHIILVVHLFREAGKAISSMPFILSVPFVTLLVLMGTLAAFVWIFLYLESAGITSVDKYSGFVKLEEDQYINYMKWYHLFGVIWMLQFILACHKMVVSGAVSQWYFTRDKATLSSPIGNSAWRLLRYHVGSIALGSLIITFVIIVRMVMSFVQNRLRGGRHPVAVFLLKCLSCCLWCFERFLQFINTDAYIEIGIYGCSFCSAARKAFRIILENAIQLVAINSVGDFVLFLGKLANVTIITVTGIELVSTVEGLYFLWLPVTLSAILAFLVTSAFLSVYETTIDTIFICYCEDIAINDGTDRPYYMSLGLRKCMTLKPTSSNKVEPLNDSSEKR